MPRFSHLARDGEARMVDVGKKSVTSREAVAQGEIRVSRELFRLLGSGNLRKGDVFAAARLAGIMAAKKTSELIPLCHPLPLDLVEVSFHLHSGRVTAVARVKSRGKTGVEMEALTAVSVALLTIYDMCKSRDKGMVISSVLLLEKKGGRSGHYIRKEGTQKQP